MRLENFFGLVRHERSYQTQRWASGDEASLDRVDRAHNKPNDFVAYIARYASAWMPGGFPPYTTEALLAFRRSMVKVATLAFSAIRWATAEMGTITMLFAGSYEVLLSQVNVDGTFNTVRVGDKWSALTPGQVLDFEHTETELPLGNGVVLETLCGPARDVLTMQVVNENHASPGGPQSLLNILRGIYGDDVTFDTTVTVVRIQGHRLLS